MQRRTTVLIRVVTLLLMLGAAAAIRTTASPATATKPATGTVKPALAAAAATKPATIARAASNISAGLHLGCIIPLAGPKANTGKAVQAAIQMAIKDYAPRLAGKPVTLTCENTNCRDTSALWGGQKLARSHVGELCGYCCSFRFRHTAARGTLQLRCALHSSHHNLQRTQATKLTNTTILTNRQNESDAIIGEVCSSASLGALGVINKFRIPLVSPASTSPALTIEDDYFYRTVPTDRHQGQFAAKSMLEGGAKTVVIASTSDSYGQELAFSFTAAFTRDGGKAYDVEVPSLTPNKGVGAVLAKLREVNADGLFIATNDVNWSAGRCIRLQSGRWSSQL